MSRTSKAPGTGNDAAADHSAVAFAACGSAILAGIALSIAGSAWQSILYILILDGGMALLWLLSAAGVGALVLRLVRIHLESKALTFATAAGLGVGIISLLVLMLGLAGLLNRGMAVAIIAGGLIAGAAMILPGAKGQRISSRPLALIEWLWLLVVASAAIAVVAACIPPGVLWGDEPHGYDVLEYHLQVPREWYEAGRIAPLEHNVFSYFPFNVEMHYLLAMHLRGGPWLGMYMAQFMHLAFVGLTVLAVYGTAASRAKPQAGIVAAVAVAATPWMTLFGSVAYNEGGLLLFGTLAIAWTIRAIDSPHPVKLMSLAGALAGFACGTKLTAMPMVLLAIPAAVVACRLFAPRIAWPACAAFLLAGLLTFSPWLVRNFAWAGNPVFPEASSIFGAGQFSQTQIERWTKAHTVRDDQRGLAPRLEAFWRQIIADWRYGFAVLPLGVLSILLGRGRVTWLLLILLLINAIVWLFFTHLQGRFFVLAIPVSGLLIGSVDWSRRLALPIVSAFITGTVGVVILAPHVAKVAPIAGLEDLRPLLPEAAANAMDSSRALVLVGDAQAFKYQRPMSQLRYRTVFDVDAKPGETVIDAWSVGAPRDAILLVDPSELRRFARTYANIPMLQSNADEPFTIERAMQP